MFYGRPVDGVLVEVVDLPKDFTPSQIFHESLAPDFVPVPDGAQPGWVAFGTSWAAPPPPVPNVKELGAQLKTSVSRACQQLTDTIITDSFHQNAFVNAANMVAANGGQAPTNDPEKTAFETFATAFGKTPDQFTVLVRLISAMSLQLSAAYTVCSTRCDAAATLEDLTNAQSGFNGSLSAIEQQIVDAGVNVAVPAVAITGIPTS